MELVEQQLLTEERALFGARDLEIRRTIFDKGESPLKESANIELYESMFRYKYPLWYSRDIKVRDCSWFEMARAGVWYSENLDIENALIEAPKNFRKCRNLSLKHVRFPNAAETLWWCDGVTLEDVFAKGDYFGMNTNNIKATGFELIGNYAFDGCRNVEITDSRMLTKDAFWNCENVTVVDSVVIGEYLGWNSRNLRFVNCEIESRQGLCCIEGLTLENCRLNRTTLAFEYVSGLNAAVTTKIDSVLNPTSGKLIAPEIGMLIREPDRIDPAATAILCPDVEEETDRLDWKKVIL